MSIRRLVLSRHGQTSYNSERRFTGWHDPPLTPIGRAEARALGRALRDVSIDAAYSSDLRRTIETGTLVLRGRGNLEAVPDSALREASFGAWQGLSFDEARARDPAEFQALLDRSVDFRAPGGESILEVHRRVYEFFERVQTQHAGETVLFVASGGPLQILVASLFGMPIAHHWRLGMANCSLSILDFPRGEPILTVLNQRSHLTNLQKRLSRPKAQASRA